ncbi:MAG: DNA-deoxyinosine glycosylase [Clostridiales bacterium]|nr:DNA-deoxyinosine glycosylase [Clostridiales bacterium]
MDNRIRSYGPVCDERSRVLVLGTSPSIQSLKAGFYYGHPRNAFWPILARAFGEPTPVNTGQKRALLLENGVALWDVVGECERPGSMDADIRNPIANDVAGLLASRPNIAAVLLNGGTAQALFRRLCPGAAGERPTVRLPSTSPAYTLPFEQKYAAWRDALAEFGGIR